MATSRKTGGQSRKGASKGGAKGGAVSLSEADRSLLDEKFREAKSRGAAMASESLAGLFDALERFGLNSQRVEKLRGMIDDMEVRDSVEKAQEYLGEQIENARDYAKENPGKVIGGAAGVLVGASLLAMALRRAGEGKRKSRAAKKSSGSKKSSSRSSGSSKSSGGSKKSSGGSKKSSGSSRRR